jgi:hypothetical protein
MMISPSQTLLSCWLRAHHAWDAMMFCGANLLCHLVAHPAWSKTQRKDFVVSVQCILLT